MSESAPSRVVGGLTPRATNTDLSRMRRANRTEQATPDKSKTPAPGPAEPTPQSDTRQHATPSKQHSPLNREQARITTYLPATVRDRAQAAYKATGHLEGDKSWSAYVEMALVAETERREALYNDGKAYEGIKERLSAGRPLN